MTANGCEFCLIANGLQAADIVFEGMQWVAISPLEPAGLGHVMVIPREHVPDVWSLTDDLGSEIMRAVIRVGRAVQAALSPGGMNLISSAGEVAEQTVFHLHVHIVPRWSGDRIDRLWPPKRTMDAAVKEDSLARIRLALEKE